MEILVGLRPTACWVSSSRRALGYFRRVSRLFCFLSFFSLSFLRLLLFLWICQVSDGIPDDPLLRPRPSRRLVIFNFLRPPLASGSVGTSPIKASSPPEPLPYCPGFILPSSIYSDTVGVLGLKTSQWLPLFPYYWSLWERSCACCRGKIHSTGSKVQGRCVWRQSTFFPYCYHFSFFFVLFFLILLSLAFLRQMGLRKKNIRNKTIIVITIKKT